MLLGDFVCVRPNRSLTFRNASESPPRCAQLYFAQPKNRRFGNALGRVCALRHSSTTQNRLTIQPPPANENRLASTPKTTIPLRIPDSTTRAFRIQNP
jgi:hypothetical protein